MGERVRLIENVQTHLACIRFKFIQSHSRVIWTDVWFSWCYWWSYHDPTHRFSYTAIICIRIKRRRKGEKKENYNPQSTSFCIKHSRQIKVLERSRKLRKRKKGETENVLEMWTQKVEKDKEDVDIEETNKN
jgi:hypothetical protein